MANKYDELYSDARDIISDFVFDDAVADVFEDMISRSVPGYAQILKLLPTLCRQFQFNGCNYYDLGCSLGAGIIAMASGLINTNSTLIGVDNSASMLKQAKPVLQSSMQHSQLKYELHNKDINHSEINNAGMVLMNFTLQFIALEQRSALIEKIYNGLVEGGAFVLSEKLSFDDALANQALTDIHHQYKADQGYSQLEISQKRDAIENVLIAETLDTHIKRLRNAGFKVVTPWVQNLQFTSILAIK